MERPPFRPGRLDPCFCRSGKRFKNCCGSRAVPRQPPFSVYHLPGFVDAAECARLVAWADEQPGKAMTIDTKDDGDDDGGRGRYHTGRITEEVDLGEFRSTAEDWIRRAIAEYIAKAYQRDMEWFEAPALMRYRPGGHFQRHADSEFYDTERKAWVKINDRDISLLLYLNDDFEGGLLSFPVFNWTYRPRAGDLLFFPSDSRFQHQAQPVTSGRRYAIVSFMAVAKAPRLHAAAPEGSIFL